jgi:hypothetical protein
VIAVRLPNLSDRLGRPVFACVETPPWYDGHDELPPDAVVLDVPRPPATMMVETPDVFEWVSWNEWLDRVLAAAIREPRMSVEDLELRGPDRDILSRALLKLWGWLADHDGEQCPEPEKGRSGPRCAHYSSMPNRTLQGILRSVSVRLRVPPHELLTWKFDELMLAFRTLESAPNELAAEDAV